jgi:hypothetical protein
VILAMARMEPSPMPVARYFLFVGGVLLALLFVIGSYAPQPPVVTASNMDSDKPLIRINSERKWPEAVVFDTSHPPVIAAPVVTAANVPAPAPEISANSRVREAYAQLQPSDPKQMQPPAIKKMAQLKPQPKRKVAQNRVGPPMVLAAQQPQPHFGFFGNSTW